MSFTWTPARLRVLLVIFSLAFLVWFVFAARAIIVPLILGIVFIFVCSPIVRWLEQRLPPKQRWIKFRRFVAICLVYAAVLGVLAGVVGSLIPPLMSEGSRSCAGRREGPSAS